MAGDLGFTTIEQLQLLPEDRRVAALRKRPESQWLDRKSARVKPRDLADAVALANAEGGLIVVGIWSGAIEGTGPDERLHNGWRQAGRDFAPPPVPAHFEVVPCINERGDADIDRFLRSVGAISDPTTHSWHGSAHVEPGAALPTVAGILTLGTGPQRFLPEARIRLLRNRGAPARPAGA